MCTLNPIRAESAFERIRKDPSHSRLSGIVKVQYDQSWALARAPQGSRSCRRSIGGKDEPYPPWWPTALADRAAELGTGIAGRNQSEWPQDARGRRRRGGQLHRDKPKQFTAVSRRRIGSVHVFRVFLCFVPSTRLCTCTKGPTQILVRINSLPSGMEFDGHPSTYKTIHPYSIFVKLTKSKST